MSLDELLEVQTRFFDNIMQLKAKQGHQGFAGFVKTTCEESPSTYFFERSRPFFRILQSDGQYRFVDEQEKIDLTTDEAGMMRLHNILKDRGTMNTIAKNQSMIEGLLELYKKGEHITIAGKPFLVYDIETTFGEDVAGQYFEMAYAIDSSKQNGEGLLYDYVDRTNMKAFTDMLLEYDGRVIGYNSLSFDNPVLIQNVGYTPEQLEILQRKSLDPFVLFRKVTGRMMSLNNVAQALIGSGKTLSSGQEGADYLKKWKETGNVNYLEKVKDYCKNDVEITLGVLLYLLKYKQVQFDGSSYKVGVDALCEHGCWNKTEEKKADSGWTF